MKPLSPSLRFQMLCLQNQILKVTGKALVQQYSTQRQDAESTAVFPYPFPYRGPYPFPLKGS